MWEVLCSRIYQTSSLLTKILHSLGLEFPRHTILEIEINIHTVNFSTLAQDLSNMTIKWVSRRSQVQLTQPDTTWT